MSIPANDRTPLNLIPMVSFFMGMESSCARDFSLEHMLDVGVMSSPALGYYMPPQFTTSASGTQHLLLIERRELTGSLILVPRNICIPPNDPRIPQGQVSWRGCL